MPLWWYIDFCCRFMLLKLLCYITPNLVQRKEKNLHNKLWNCSTITVWMLKCSLFKERVTLKTFARWLFHICPPSLRYISFLLFFLLCFLIFPFFPPFFEHIANTIYKDHQRRFVQLHLCAWWWWNCAWKHQWLHGERGWRQIKSSLSCDSR